MHSLKHRLRLIAAGRRRSLVARLRGLPDLKSLERAGMMVGARVYAGYGCFLDPDFCFLIQLGDDVTLSVNVTLLVHDASTRRTVGFSRIAPVTLEAGVFVGACAVILPGVTVGYGAVIAAGSVVRDDVPRGAVVAGNPARIIGDVASYADRHRLASASQPRWSREYRVSTGISAEQVEEMRAALERHGEGYVR